MSNEFSVLISNVFDLVRNTGLFIKSELGRVSNAQIETKALNSLVSYVDKKAEEILVSGLSSLIPDSGFVTEEDTVDDLSKDYIWIIDPLDGTTNFLRQIPHFSVSVALQINGEIILGFVYNIMLDEMFSAGKGFGAFMNNQPINVSETNNFSEAIIATGFPYEVQNEQFLAKVIQKIMLDARGIRRFGSAALDLAYVAIGRFDAYYECCLNPWDVAAGILIVQEAGGIVTDYSGGNNYENGKEIIASTPKVLPKLLNIIRESREEN